MRVDMANRIELATTLFFVWKNSDPPPALLAGLGSVRVNIWLDIEKRTAPVYFWETLNYKSK